MGWAPSPLPCGRGAACICVRVLRMCYLLVRVCVHSAGLAGHVVMLIAWCVRDGSAGQARGMDHGVHVYSCGSSRMCACFCVLALSKERQHEVTHRESRCQRRMMAAVPHAALV